MVKKKTKPFASEEKEFLFWQKEESADSIDWTKAASARFPDLKKSVESISLRLPKSLLQELKIQANKRDIPYQSLLKIILSEGLKQH